MNTINLKVNFEKGTIKINGIDLVENDYNSTKIIFEFDAINGRKLFKMNNPLGELVYSGFIENNELILGGVDANDNVVSLFSMAGQYPFEIVLYDDSETSKLTSTSDYLNVEEEVVKIGDEVAEVYLPVFDEMIQELDEAITKTDNLNIDAIKEDNVTTVEITYKDGETKTVEILDGETGATGNGISSINKTSTSELVDTYTIFYTNGNSTTYDVTNGKDGEDYVITQQDYNAIAGVVETDLQPTIQGIENTANTANTTANTAKSIAEGANQALSYSNYQTMITAFNSFDDDKFNIGQNVMIVTLNVPDLWISSIESTSSTYTYTTDEAFTTELATNGYVQVGYYKLSALETQKVDLTNYVTNTDYATQTVGGTLKINGVYDLNVSSGTLTGVSRTYEIYQARGDNAVISKGTLENVITGKGLVKNTDYATNTNAGVIKTSTSYGTGMVSGGYLRTVSATNTEIDGKTNSYKPIVPSNLDYAVRSVQPAVTQAQASSTQALTDNAIYDMLITGNTTFTLPTISDSAKLHTIEIRCTIQNNPTINLGTTHYIGDEPEFENGNWIIYYEYAGGMWLVGAIEVTSEA